VLGGLFVAPASVSAHTDLDFSTPADGDVVDEPVSEITVAFTEPVSLVDDGFEVLDPQGNLIVPMVVTDDDQTYVLQLDPAIGGGDAGVAYEVRSTDGHVVDGTFSFTVTAPPPTSTTTVPVTTAPATTTPATTSPATLAPTSSTTSPTEPTGAPTTTAGSDTEATDPTGPEIPTTVVDSTVADGVDQGDDDGSSSTWIVLGIVGVAVIGVAAFFLFRPRSST
jgi:methionine-rich copper-binding protein CopC